MAFANETLPNARPSHSYKTLGAASALPPTRSWSATGRRFWSSFRAAAIESTNNFPGGGVEVGETLVQGVRREVREETCLEVDVERVLLVVESVGTRNTNEIGGVQVPWNEVRFFFLCTPVDGSEARLPEGPDPNQTGVRWFPLSQLPSLNVLPQVGEQLIAALETGAPFLVVPNPHP